MPPTQEHVDGEASAGSYSRAKELDDDFTRLAALPIKRVLDLVRNESVLNKSRTREEVMVSLCRLWHGSGKIDEAWAMAQVLTTRIRGRVARTIQVWKLDFPPPLRDEVLEEISTDFYQSLFDPSPTFFEVRFWVALDRNLLDVVRRRRREHENVPAFTQSVDSSEFEEARNADTTDLLPRSPGISDPVTAALVSEALLSLPAAERHAFVLKHFAGYREESSKDDAGTTISSALRVSGRTVRNYLSRAEMHLAKWREGIVSKDGLA